MPRATPEPVPATINVAYELVDVSTLQTHPRNPRQGDIGALYELIRKNGFVGALTVQKSTRQIIAGNHRFRAAVEAGYLELPVIWVDVDDDKALELVLADNYASDQASNNSEALLEILQELHNKGRQIEATGYTLDDLEDLRRDSERTFSADTSFLDRFQETGEEEDESVETTPANEIDDQADPDPWVKLSFTIRVSDRDALMAGVNRRKREQGFDAAVDALVSIVKEVYPE